ncbi:transporter suffix domain-containing protein [Bacillus songklensis]|uniref:Transporter suffix domain-containing protein n=1 Tax=Bacillus songklensis TaxID=1069116 RepID=A0ABV8B5B8_9BACI
MDLHLNTKEKKPILYRIGISLIIFSFLIWAIPVIVPFMSLDSSRKVVVVTSSLILAEIIFWIGVAIVGKEVAMKFRGYFNPRKWRKGIKERVNQGDSRNDDKE